MPETAAQKTKKVRRHGKRLPKGSHGGIELLDGHVYGASMNYKGGRWVCLDWNTGETKYAEKGVGKGAVALADGMLIVLSERRDVGLVPATPEAHRVIARFKLPSGGEGESWAHPVVGGGVLYLRHADRLEAYDLREPHGP